MYVAMTRAKEELYISRAMERFYFWDYVRNPESRFFKEINKDFIEEVDLSNYIDSSSKFFSTTSNFDFQDITINNFSWEKIAARLVRKLAENDIANFNIWDKVKHPKFWNRIITWMSWEIATIAFTWVWSKKLNIKIAPVRKI